MPLFGGSSPAKGNDGVTPVPVAAGGIVTTEEPFSWIERVASIGVQAFIVGSIYGWSRSVKDGTPLPEGKSVSVAAQKAMVDRAANNMFKSGVGLAVLAIMFSSAGEIVAQIRAKPSCDPLNWLIGGSVTGVAVAGADAMSEDQGGLASLFGLDKQKQQQQQQPSKSTATSTSAGVGEAHTSSSNSTASGNNGPITAKAGELPQSAYPRAENRTGFGKSTGSGTGGVMMRFAKNATKQAVVLGAAGLLYGTICQNMNSFETQRREKQMMESDAWKARAQRMMAEKTQKVGENAGDSDGKGK